MAREALTGSRIRERRIMVGLKQAELAKLSGISASYLNLIEHNRRRIGGKLLLSISKSLDVEPQALTEGAEVALISTLREAADTAGMSAKEAERADEFANRFPGWAEVLAETRRQVTTLEQTVEALTDRMSHDPHLAASIHELLSTAAAIRSTASILAETETLQKAWQDRFHANIHEDSRRLSASAEALASYFDADLEAADAATAPQDEVEAFLAARVFSFPELEADTADATRIDALIQDAPQITSAGARFMARMVLEQVHHDAAALSLSDLRAAVETHGLVPERLAPALGCPVPLLLRRLAALPELGCGLVVCDRSGTVLYRKSVEGFTVPRFGASCPLWPLFAVLGQPGFVAMERIEQVGRSDAAFDCIAAAEIQPSHLGYNTPPLMQAVMLQVPAKVGEGQRARLVGTSCRVCSMETCAARREPSILTEGL